MPNGDNFEAIAKDENAFRLWTISKITRIETDVGWIKKVSAPLTFILAFGVIIDLLLRLSGH